MKNLYVNSRLKPLLISARRATLPPEWIFSLGEPWLHLTPGRLVRVTMRLGLVDPRISHIIKLLRRHSPTPELYCRKLGIAESFHVSPKEYPLTLCPRCDGVQHVHPLEENPVCCTCREQERLAEAARQPDGQVRDLFADRIARVRLLSHSALALHEESIHPPIVHGIPLRKEKEARKTARTSINLGVPYRVISGAVGCSIGWLSKVKHWELN